MFRFGRERGSRLSRLAIAVSFLAALCGCVRGGPGGRVMPTVMLPTPTTDEIEGMLSSVFKHSKPPDLSSFGGAVVTCKALGCPVPGAVHVDYVPRVHDRLDFSGFEFIERRRGVSLARKAHTSGQGDYSISHRTLGGWMDHSFFLIETMHESHTSDFIYRTYSIGSTRYASPAVSVSGTWSGIMVGVVGSFANKAGSFVRGDATVTVTYPDLSREALVDVEFKRITNEETRAEIKSMTWKNLVLDSGQFGAGNVLFSKGGGYFSEVGLGSSPGGSIFGQFYGPNHGEVGGLFNRNGVAGGFGANRNTDGQ